MRLDVKEEAPWRMLRIIDIGKEKQLNLIPCLCPSNFRCGSVCMISDSMSKFCVYCWAWVLLFVCISYNSVRYVYMLSSYAETMTKHHLCILMYIHCPPVGFVYFAYELYAVCLHTG